LLVCGVEGSVSGLAVTMLPLFDLVFADETATFSLPHAKIGSNPEGISILQFSGKVRPNAVSF
jgi:enoyl-CoA hydratase/carnithine racemase